MKELASWKVSAAFWSRGKNGNRALSTDPQRWCPVVNRCNRSQSPRRQPVP